jgi:hypothetical protein
MNWFSIERFICVIAIYFSIAVVHASWLIFDSFLEPEELRAGGDRIADEIITA